MALEKNTKKHLAREYAAHTKKIGCLLKRFTPINPTDEYSMGDDYESSLPQIVSSLLRGPNRNDLVEILEQRRRDWEAPPDKAKDEKIADTILKSFITGAPLPPPKIEFCLDLRNDLSEIESYFLRRIKEFDSKTNNGPGRSNSIGQIAIGFQCFQSGWVVMVFDTRPCPSHDGEWTSYLDDSIILVRDNWAKASASNFRGPVAVIDTNGNETFFEEAEAKLTEHCGNLIRQVVTDFRNRDLFSDLPIASNCEIFVEDFDGYFSWPDCDTPGVRPVR